MECFYRSQPSVRGYRRRMYEIWKHRFPQTTITEQGLLNQKRSIEKNKLLTNIELQEIANHADHAYAVANNDDVSNTSNQQSPVAQTSTINDTVQLEQLTEEQQHIKVKLAQYMSQYADHTLRQTIRKMYIDPSLIHDVNAAAAHVQTEDLTELNALFYAAARVIEERVTSERRHHHQVNLTPPWKRRLENQINTIRTEVNRLQAAKQKNGRIPPYMIHKYRMDYRGINEVLEDAKQRLIAISHRLRRYEKRNEQFRINKVFRNNPQKVYRQFRGQTKTEDVLHYNKDELVEYWKERWELPVNHNNDASWLSEIERKSVTITPQQSIVIAIEDVKHKLASMANWKAPGPDSLQTYWIKKLPILHQRLAKNYNTLLRHPQTLPRWMTTGRTLLLRKDEGKPPTPDNFRPITCLPTMGKLFMGVLTNKINTHVRQNNILHYEQKGARARCRGAKDHLAVDRAVTNDSRKRHTNLTMAWIDYRKAFDSLPHSWIMKCLSLYKVDASIQDIVRISMQHWSTNLTCGKEKIGDINIKRGIFQGDSLSPLLFCLAMNPLSDVLHETGLSYVMKNGQIMSLLAHSMRCPQYISKVVKDKETKVRDKT